MNRTKKIKELFNSKYLKMYELDYEDKFGIDRKWNFVSRKKDPVPISKSEKEDAVIIIPILIGKNKPFDIPHNEFSLVVTKEYRAPLGDYEYGSPAGLVEKGESIEKAAKRELKEETGLTLSSILKKTPLLYSSSGMTDESVRILLVECYGNISNKYNEDSEDIEILLINLNDMYDYFHKNKDIFPKDSKFSSKSYLFWMNISDYV